MKNIYLLLAIVGAVAPYAFFVQHFQTVGLGFGDFVASLFANPAASGFTADLLISSVVLWVFLYHERRVQHPWALVVVNLAIGLSCAFPLYLYMRSGQLAHSR